MNLYTPIVKDISRETKQVFNSLKLRWKTERFTVEEKVTVMGIRRPEGNVSRAPYISEAPPFQIMSSTMIKASLEK